MFAKGCAAVNYAVLCLIFEIVDSQNPSVDSIAVILDSQFTKNMTTASLIHLRNWTDFEMEIQEIFLNESVQEEWIDTLCCAIQDFSLHGKIPSLFLDLTNNYDKGEVVKTVTHMLNIPTVSFSPVTTPFLNEDSVVDGSQSNLVQIHPLSSTLSMIIKDFVLHLNMSSAAILYEPRLDFVYLYQNLLVNIQCQHTIWPIGDLDAINSQMQQLDFLRISNVFIVGSSMFLTSVVNEDSGSIQCASCHNCSVVHVYPSWNHPSQQNQSVFEILSQHNSAFDSNEILKSYMAVLFQTWRTVRRLNARRAGAMEFVTCSRYAPGKVSAGSRPDLKHHFESAADEIYFQIIMDKQGHYHFNNTYEISRLTFTNSFASKLKLGQWFSYLRNDRLFLGPNASVTKGSTVYKVVINVKPPFIIRVNEGGGIKYVGYCIDVLNEISTLQNFSYELYESPDRKYGQLVNGEWTGIVGELVRQKADVGLADLTLESDREEVIDFSIPYYEMIGMAILMKRIDVPDNLFKFLSVLDIKVWLCIAAAYFCMSILMALIECLSPFSYRNIAYSRNAKVVRIFTLRESLWFCLTSLTPQGGGEAPRQLSGRILAASWWLFSFIIIASYTANLAAFLTIRRLENPISSIDDLVDQYELQYGPLKGSQNEKYFQKMALIEEKFHYIWKSINLNDELNDIEKINFTVWEYPLASKYIKMWKQMQEINLPNTVEEALEKVAASTSETVGFAFIADASLIQYIVRRNCSFIMVGEEFGKKPFAFGLQKGSHLLKEFNEIILHLLNERKLQMFKEKWWSGNVTLQCSADTDNNGITIANIGGVFIIVLIGIFFSGCTLIFEYHYYKRHRNTSRKLQHVWN